MASPPKNPNIYDDEADKPLLTKQESVKATPRSPYEPGGFAGSIQDPKRREFNLRWKYYNSLTLKSDMKSIDFPQHIVISGGKKRRNWKFDQIEKGVCFHL